MEAHAEVREAGGGEPASFAALTDAELLMLLDALRAELARRRPAVS